MGKPCDSIEVHLRSVQTPNSKHQSRQEKNVRYESATVLHIVNSAKYSFINENLVRKLLPISFGSDIPAIESGSDTIVELEWRYPGVNTTEVTTHYVLRESRYQITLRKEDWERPMRNFLIQEFPKKQWRQRNVMSPPPRVSPPVEAEDPKDEGSDSETESESDAVSEPNSPLLPSRTSTVLSDYWAGECTETCVGEYQEYKHRHKRDDAASRGIQGTTEKVNTPKEVTEIKRTDQLGEGQVKPGEHDWETEEEADDWLQFEIVDTESEDEGPEDKGPEEKKEDPYWTWSQNDSRWFHKNPDGSTLWFPKLV